MTSPQSLSKIEVLKTRWDKRSNTFSYFQPAMRIEYIRFGEQDYKFGDRRLIIEFRRPAEVIIRCLCVAKEFEYCVNCR